MTGEIEDGAPAVRKAGPWLFVLLVALGAAGLAVLISTNLGPPARSSLPPSFDYDLGRYAKIDPKLVGYRQTAFLRVEMPTLLAIAVGPDDAIYVAGDRTIQVLKRDGRLRSQIRLGPDGPPRCLAVDDEAVYVGFDDQVAVFRPDGNPSAAWEPLGPRAALTSIAVDQNDVFVADAGNKCVLRYDRSGRIRGEIARRDPGRDVPGLVVPSPHCDVAVGSDGLLRVVNPGRHRIDFYTREGDFESPLGWGRRGTAVECFCGCCNPVAIALLDGDRVVTAERGIPRVKVYSPEGRLVSVVATPEQLMTAGTLLEETRAEHQLPALDLAADSRGRILVLDPGAGGVRVFETADERR